MMEAAIKTKLDNLTKPLGSLGMLEDIAFQICTIQQTLKPELRQPYMLIFAADHGIAINGVSAYPQQVTAQMLTNFATGGAAINVFCRQHQIDLRFYDTGVKNYYTPHPKIRNLKIANGTNDFSKTPAMSMAQMNQCFTNGAEVIENLLSETECNIVGFGEMGIGNTTASAMLMHAITQIPLKDCVGKGTGINSIQLSEKLRLLESVSLAYNLNTMSMNEKLAAFGGFEILTMAGAMCQAARHNLIVLIDGFISTVAWLIATTLHPDIKSNAIYCHQSSEKGHDSLLKFLNAKPILQLNLRLGEGSGVAVAYPIIVSAVNMVNEMATFETARVDKHTA